MRYFKWGISSKVVEGNYFKWSISTEGIFTTIAHLAVVVIESKNCLIDLPTFSYSPTRTTRDIVMEGNELEEIEEIKTLWKAILELCWVMPHSDFGATLNPDHLRKFDPPPKFFFFKHSKVFLLNDLLGFPLNEHLWVRSWPFSGCVSRFAEFFFFISNQIFPDTI